jgi:hypothetical protein
LILGARQPKHRTDRLGFTETSGYVDGSAIGQRHHRADTGWRVRRALAALFRGAVSKDIVSRIWRKIKSDWDARNGRSLTDDRWYG